MKVKMNKEFLRTLTVSACSVFAFGVFSACKGSDAKTIEKFVCEQTQINAAYQTVCELPTYYVTYSDGSVEKAGILLSDTNGESVSVSNNLFFVEQEIGTSYKAVYYAGEGKERREYEMSILVVDDSQAPELILNSQSVCVSVGDYVNLLNYYQATDDSGIQPQLEYTLSYNGETKNGDGAGFIAQEGLYTIELRVTDPSGHSSNVAMLNVIARYGNVIADFENETDIRSQENPKGVRVQGAAFPTRSKEKVHGGKYSLFVNNNLNASVTKIIPFNASGYTNGDTATKGDLIGMWYYFMSKDESGMIDLAFTLAPDYIEDTQGEMEIYVDGAYYAGANAVGESASGALEVTLPTEKWVYVQYSVVKVDGNFFVGCNPIGYTDNNLQFYVDDIVFGMKSDLRVFNYMFDLGTESTVEVDCEQTVKAYIFSRSIKNKRENANYQVFREIDGKLERIEPNDNGKYTLSQGLYRAYLANRDNEYGGIYATISITKNTFASVSFNMKGNDALPNGIVNVEYPLVEVSCDTSILVTKKVFSNYGGVNVQEIALNANDCFLPTEIGLYTLEYTFEKGEEKSVQTFNVLIFESGDELQTNFAEIEKLTTAFIGETYVLPTLETSGGVGKTITALKITAPDGTILDVSDNKVVFPVAGTYKIVYEIGDWLTTQTYEYSTVVIASDLPIVEVEAVMPRYFSEGYEYALDDVTGKLYTENGSYTDLTLTPYLRYNGADTLLEDSVVTPIVNDSGDIVQIVYKANVSGQEKDVRVYSVPVKKVCSIGDTRIVNARELFDVDNASVEITSDGAKFTAVKNENRISVISPLLLEGLQLHFFVPQSGLTAIKLTLTDSIDANDIIVISIVSATDGKIYAEYNGIRTSMDGSFSDGNILLSYNTLYKAFYDGKNSKVVSLSTDTCFFSNKVYLDISLIGEQSDTEKQLIIRKLNGQGINDDTAEYSAPGLYVEDFNIVNKKGTTFTIPRVIVSDLYDANPTVWVKVQKNGKTVSSTNGVLLNYVLADTYSFELTESGSYTIIFMVEDCFGNTKTYQKTVWSFDDDAFALKISGEKEIRVAKNSVVNVPAYEVVGGNDVSVYVYLCDEQGQYEKLTGNTFKVTEKGTYKIAYYAVDKNNVIQIEYVEIIVE